MLVTTKLYLWAKTNNLLMIQLPALSVPYESCREEAMAVTHQFLALEAVLLPL